MANSEINDCLSCKTYAGMVKPPGGIFYTDDLFYASHAFIPENQSQAYLGWLIISPIRHLPGLADLYDLEAQHMGLLTTKFNQALMQTNKDIEHIYLFVLGHHVPHLHLHLVPRYHGTPKKYWGFKVDEWSEAPKGDIQGIEIFYKELLANFNPPVYYR